MRMAGLAGLLFVSGALHAQPSTDQILAEMGFSAAEQRLVLDGEFVTAKIGAVSERDLAFAVAFLVKTSPEKLSEQVLAGTRRAFYVSTGYNAEQSVAGLLPVAGGTVVLYMTHAFTDQVAGSAGSMKRSIGSRIMADQMKGIFETSRKQIER